MAARTKSRPGYTDTHGAAEYIGFAYQTLINWRHLGTGPDYVIRRGRVRYAWAALDDYMRGESRA